MIDLICYKQTDDSRCGPAVVRSILNHYGIKVSEDEVAKACNHSYKKGCTNIDIKNALMEYGIGAHIWNDATIDELRYHVREGRPVIVDWFTSGVRPGLSDVPNGHSSIVVGFRNSHIYLADPEIGDIRKVAIPDFMRVWFDWEHDEYLKSDTPIIRRNAIVPFDLRTDRLHLLSPFSSYLYALLS